LGVPGAGAGVVVPAAGLAAGGAAPAGAGAGEVLGGACVGADEAQAVNANATSKTSMRFMAVPSKERW
jgi:hypothetical protein